MNNSLINTSLVLLLDLSFKTFNEMLRLKNRQGKPRRSPIAMPSQNIPINEFSSVFDIRKLDEKAFDLLGIDWLCLSTLTEPKIEQLVDQGFVVRGVELLSSKLNTDELVLLNDPSMTMLLPLWERVFEELQLVPSILIAFTSPAWVAQASTASLEFSSTQIYLCWLNRALACLRFSAGKPTVLINYDRMVRSQEQFAQLIAQVFPVGVKFDLLLEDCRALLSSASQQTAQSFETVLQDPLCPALAKDVVRGLVALDSGQLKPSDAHFQEMLDVWLIEFDRLKAVFDLLDSQFKSLAHASQEQQEIRKRVDSLEKTLAQRDSVLSGVFDSTNWRIAQPIRVLSRFVRSLMALAGLGKYVIDNHGSAAAVAKVIYRVCREEGLAGIRSRVNSSSWRQSNASGKKTTVAQWTHSSSKKHYARWVRLFDTIDNKKRADLERILAQLRHKPLISVIMPTFNGNPDWLRKAVESVQNQIYPHWELCIADDASTDTRSLDCLKQLASTNARIKVKYRRENGHISAASNSALELATGEWIALLDHDDLLSEDALLRVVELINKLPDIQLIYSDEDKIDTQGNRLDPYFKCDWNLDLFYSQNVFCHLGVYRTDLVRSVGGFRLGLEGSQDYDLVLRCIEQIQPRQIIHIPRVLYHWRVHAQSTAQTVEAKPYAVIAGEKALNEHFARLGVNGSASWDRFGYKVSYEMPTPLPLVSLLIPTRDCKPIVERAVISILEKTDYQNYEIIIIDNGSVEPETIAWFDAIQALDNRVRVIRYDAPFNYSAINNFGVQQALGAVIGLINNDIEVISPDWLTQMVQHAVRPEIGCVGAKLYYPDGRVQHAGVVLGVGGVAGHAHKYASRQAHGYFSRLMIQQNFSAVTAACLLVKRSVFESVGGLDEINLKVAFNDVDFCLKVREAGYRNLWTPYAELYHHESLSRGTEDTPEKKARFRQEVLFMQNRWGNQLQNDPCYSPNLSLEHEDFSLGWPPRVSGVQ
jgi:GT2 family glycosyltransferase